MPATIEQLGPQHTDALRSFLAKDSTHNIYLLGLFEEFGIVPRAGRARFAFHGRFDGKNLTAALFVGGEGGLVVPSASDPAFISELAESLGSQLRLQASVGEKPTVDALVRILGNNAKPRLSRVQRLFAVSADDLGPFTNPILRLAKEEDLPRLMPLALGAVRELMERDPLAEDPNGYEARVMQRVRGRRTYVLEENGTLIFKVDIGSRSQHGAELEGLYTLPQERNKGHATLCLGQICRHLLSSLPRLVIRVDEKDESTARIARKVGFLAGRVQRLVLLE
ncbi:GNAT family N-acetyltransferase [Hyalangium minutum]|nr:GNAT family N-acetyltransferase [Hyalangium minutum]